MNERFGEHDTGNSAQKPGAGGENATSPSQPREFTAPHIRAAHEGQLEPGGRRIWPWVIGGLVVLMGAIAIILATMLNGDADRDAAPPSPSTSSSPNPTIEFTADPGPEREEGSRVTFDEPAYFGESTTFASKGKALLGSAAAGSSSFGEFTLADYPSCSIKTMAEPLGGELIGSNDSELTDHAIELLFGDGEWRETGNIGLPTQSDVIYEFRTLYVTRGEPNAPKWSALVYLRADAETGRLLVAINQCSDPKESWKFGDASRPFLAIEATE